MRLVCIEADLLCLFVYMAAYALLIVNILRTREVRRIREEEPTLTESDSEDQELMEDEREEQGLEIANEEEEEEEEECALPEEARRPMMRVRKSPRSSSRRRICSHCSEKHAWSVDHGVGDHEHDDHSVHDH